MLASAPSCAPKTQPHRAASHGQVLLHRRVGTHVQRQRARVCIAQAGSSNSHAGHAVLHDFCMTIPYGGAAAVAGVIAFVFKAPAIGLQLVAAAAIVGLCSVLSLRSWKAGGSSGGYTLASAGASGWIAYQMWQRVAASLAPVPSGIMLALSTALCAFCLYNIVAGGNPPPAKKAA